MTVGIVFAFLFGLAVGSFLNVCIYRIPLKKSIVHPPSSCPQCGSRIRFYDNIPVLSYIVLLGRCRQCRARISPRYPLVEVIVGLLSVVLFIQYKPSLQYLFLFLFAAALVAVAFIDLDHKIIPDVISLPGILVGLAFSFFPSAGISPLDALIGAAGGAAFLLLVGMAFEKVTGREGMGGGDVKLLAMIGAWMGWKALPFIVLISSFTGAVIGGLSLVVSRQGMRSRIPFGPFLALGALLFLFFGDEIALWFDRLGR
ncbi:MAG: prepilin peptidase [Deltaproteobacteria bacterium]|nr:prepilin peptidase [Deltaproteobacteria bacterium]